VVSTSGTLLNGGVKSYQITPEANPEGGNCKVNETSPTIRIGLVLEGEAIHLQKF
jgi:hypothetical protein